MTIEFYCPQCQQSLRVPDDAAGRHGKCPRCATIFSVPLPGSGGSMIVGPPTGPAGNLQGGPAPPQRNPFADEPVVNPYDVGGIPAQQTAPLAFQQFGSELPVMPQAVDAGAVINLSVSLWQRHLGLLLGTHLILIGIAMLVGFGQLVVLSSFYDYEPFGVLDRDLSYHLATTGMAFFSSVVQSYFWIGQVQICLKLGRNQPAEIGDLFLAGDRFVPTVISTLLISGSFWAIDFLYTVAVMQGLTFGDADAAIMVGYSVGYLLAGAVCTVLLWPVPYLVIDRKAAVLQSYGMALRLTQINIGTSLLLMLLTVVFVIVGYCACFVGLLFALPLVSLLWSTAYLMLAGQIPAHNWVGEQARYG